MDYKATTREATKIETFLNARDWCIDGDLAGVVDRANKEIGRIQQDAIRAIVSKLERYQEEAAIWAANSMTDLEGNPKPISKREQQKSATDARRIGQALEKIGRKPTFK